VIKKVILMEEKKSNSIWINWVLLILFIGAMLYVSLKYGRSLIGLVKNPEKLRDEILSYGRWSILALMAAQVVQVVIAFIPGEAVQMMGGYIFGSVMGTVYSLIGITAGAAIVFFIVRITGYPLVRAFVSKRNMERFSFLMENKKGQLAMFVLFLIPGIPKDVLVYIAGLTPIKPGEFFTIFVIARLPALAASCWFGSSLYENNYVMAGIITAVTVILVVISIIKRDKIIEYFNKIEKKISSRSK
jgi:uncharacterized membrane protein YdjX (TVP38/TMEM64 family)